MIWQANIEVPSTMLVPAGRGRKDQLKKVKCGLPALGNMRDWKHKAQIVAKHRQLCAMAAARRGLEGLPGLALPRQDRRYDVLFIRIAPRLLDAGIIVGRGVDEKRLGGDNGTSWAKGWRDALAAWLGLDDADPSARWHCGQERAPMPHQHLVKMFIADWGGSWHDLPDRWLRGQLR